MIVDSSEGRYVVKYVESRTITNLLERVKEVLGDDPRNISIEINWTTDPLGNECWADGCWQARLVWWF